MNSLFRDSYQREARDTWRLIYHSTPACGAWNMAVDEAILEACGQDSVRPTLRVYAWEPPCLSLGLAQPLTDVDLDRLTSHGWDLVRRPTGGRAVLHTDELTYSVIGGQNEPRLGGGVLASYLRLAQALVKGLNLLGLSADMERELPSGSKYNTNPVCFEVPSTYEITVAGRKLLGSAQARRREGILQHGSLPLRGDLTRILDVLRYEDEIARGQAVGRLLKHAATVEDLLGDSISWEQAAQAVIQAFQETLDFHLEPGELSKWENDRASELLEKKNIHL